MPTFLESHFKIQQLQSRLSKNQYLSNQCLPNFIDAKVFKALKTHDKIPKRNLYPFFYHWYILMRQFSETSLEHWLKNRDGDYRNDNIVYEAVKVICGQGSLEKKKPSRETLENVLIIDKRVENTQKQISASLLPSQSSKQQSKNQSSIELNSFEIPKVSSHIEKKPKSQSDSAVSYIMDIKLNSEIISGYENIRKVFETQTVKLESIKVINGSDVGYDVRVFFLTVEAICEELKGKVLACANVQTIQCKKHKRNQSL